MTNTLMKINNYGNMMSTSLTSYINRKIHLATKCSVLNHYSFLLFILVMTACQSDRLPSVEDSFEDNVVNKDISHIISPETAVAYAQEFRSSFLKHTTRLDKETTDVASVHALQTKQISHSVLTRSSIEGLVPDTLLYIVNFADDSGYSLVSALSSMPGVIAYVEDGSLAPEDSIDNPGFLYFLDGFTEMTISDDPWEWHYPDDLTIQSPTYIYIPSYTITSQQTPLLTTKWGQGNPYNLYCYADSGYHAYAGCAAIAVAQAMAYYQYPASFDGHVYNWNAIMQYEQVPATDTVASNSVAMLVHDIGVEESMNYGRYGVRGSSCNFSNIQDAFDAFGYQYVYNYNFASFDTIMTDVSNCHPVVMMGTYQGTDSEGTPKLYGHGWVVDGYLTIMIDPNGPTTNMVHCNWGWNGIQNGYFIFGAFERMFQQQGRYLVGDRPYNDNNYYYRSIYPDYAP